MKSQTVLLVLRVLVVVQALGVVGLGVWSKMIVHGIEAGGDVLDKAGLSASEEEGWRAFIQAATGGGVRLWIAIIAGSFTVLATTLVLVSRQFQKLLLPASFLLPLELLSTLSMATTLGATLSLALAFPSTLPPPGSSPDLKSFSIQVLSPLTRVLAIASGAATFLSLTTTISFLIHTIHRIRDSKAFSFEPSAGGLGMGDGYEIPAMYGSASEEEKGLVGAGAEMGVREYKEEDVGAPRPLAGTKEVDRHVRPHRPWSEIARP